MNIAVAYPDRPRWPKMEWVAQGFRQLGHRVVQVRSLFELRQADTECELVLFCQKGAGLNVPDVTAMFPDRKSFWVVWQFDLAAMEVGKPLAEQRTVRRPSRSSGGWHDSDMLKQLRACDLALVKERGLLDEYRALGVPAEWMDQACPADLRQCSHGEIPEWDVLLWGSKAADWRQRRHDLSTLLTEGVSVAWAGHPSDQPPRGVSPLDWTPPDKLPSLASRAGVVLCCGYRHDLDGYWSDRLWLACGMGACVVHRKTPGLPPGPFLTYDTDDELLAVVRDMHGDREGRERLGEAARRWVMNGHTYGHRVAQLLRRVRRCRDQTSRPAAPATAAAESR